MNVERTIVSDDYFTTMGMPLLAGRGFTEGDRQGTHKVAVVNEKFVHRFFGQPQNAISRYFVLGAGNVKTDIGPNRVTACVVSTRGERVS